jgi:hypothetical protein
MNSWFEKYIKYKSKYSKLKKNLYGGVKITDGKRERDLSLDEINFLENKNYKQINNIINVKPEDYDVILNSLYFNKPSTQNINSYNLDVHNFSNSVGDDGDDDDNGDGIPKTKVKVGGPRDPGGNGDNGNKGDKMMMGMDGRAVSVKEKQKKINKERISLKEIVPKIHSYKLGKLENVNLNELINLVGQRFGYLTGSEEDAEKRFNFLLDYNKNDEYKAYKIYNEESEQIQKDYDILEKIFNKSRGVYNTYFYNYDDEFKQTYMRKIEGVDKSNVKILNLGGFEKREVIYKDFDYVSNEVSPQLYRINEVYKFVESCKRIKQNIDQNFEDFSIKVVDVQDVIFLKESKKCTIGYTMEKVDGMTLEQIRRNDPLYYQQNRQKFLEALKHIFSKLTDNNFLINDFHLDNVMWDYKTNTLTLIDITPTSFREEHYQGEIMDNNRGLIYNLENLL